jgi:hypothetical protein
MSELGKYAKLNGKEHPRDIRRIDPVPGRVTPKAKVKRSPQKLWGYQYKWVGFAWSRRPVCHQWFKTEGQRDQAMADFKKRIVSGYDFLELIGPVYRGQQPPQTGDNKPC